jgi:O-antigen/teichoic acid export membrane protein
MIKLLKGGLRNLLPKNRFARSVSVLVGGTVSAQLLTILAAPLLTRLYSPEDFGMLSVYSSLLALINVVSSLRYELAIPLPENDAEAANVTVLSLILVAASSLLTGILVLPLRQTIANALNVPTLANYLWLLPLGVLLTGTYNVFNYWSIRTNSFTTIASTRLRQAVIGVAVQLSAFNLGGIALLFAQVIGGSVGTMSLVSPAIASNGFRQVTWIGITKAAGRYRRFLIFSTWEGFFNSVSHQLAPLGFAVLFNTSVVGFYALANKIISLPISIIGQSVSQVFFATAADARDKIKIQELFEIISGRLAQIGLPAIVLFALVAPDFFEMVFGADWRKAGIFAQWMMPWLYFQFIGSTLSPIFMILEQQLQGMLWQMLLLSLRGLALVFGGFYGEIEKAIIYFSMASALAYLVQIVWLGRLVGAKQSAILKTNLIALVSAMVIASPVFLSNYISGRLEHFIAALLASILLLVFRYFYLLR